MTEVRFQLERKVCSGQWVAIEHGDAPTLRVAEALQMFYDLANPTHITRIRKVAP